MLFQYLKLSNDSENLVPTLNAVPWHSKDVIIGLTLVSSLFLGFLIGSSFILKTVGTETNELILPVGIGVLQSFMIAVVWYFTVRKYQAPWSRLGLTIPFTRLTMIFSVTCLFASLLFTAFYSLMVTTLGIEFLVPEQPLDDLLLGHGFTKVLNIILIGLWGPFAEELFFRGFVLAALSPTVGTTKAILISAGAFSLAHMAIGTLIPIFMTGIILGWLYVKTKSLWAPVMVHVTQNMIALAAISSL